MPSLKAQPFQVTKILDCTLVLGDCKKYLETVDYHTIDLVVTDPPYGISHQTNHRVVLKTPDMIHGDKDLTAISTVAPIIRGKLKGSGAIYCFCSPTNVELVLPLVKQIGSVKNLMVWDKGNLSHGDLYNAYGAQYENIVFAVKGDGRRLKRRTGDILRYSRLASAMRNHFHEKPYELLKFLVENTTDEGDLVCDPFMGSGSTAEACIKLGRRFLGCEIDPKYFVNAVERVQGTYCQMGHSHKKTSPVLLRRSS